MKLWTALTIVTAAMACVTSFAQADEPHAKSIRIYNTYCVQCHGINRDGNGINSRDMAVKPRDHTEAGMNNTSDEELHKAIKEGGSSVNKSVLMPKWGNVLSDAEISDMVGYLRVVSKSGGK